MSEVNSISRTDTNTPRRANPNPTWIPVVLLAIWLAMEIGRPPSPMKIPLICSLILGGYWVSHPHKRWDPVLICIVGFILTGWLGVPFSVNRYSAFWACYSLTITTTFICIPAAHFMLNLRQIHLFVGTLLAATAYVGIFAITHSGFGPAGASGGQDENYVAAAMSAALPFAYFSLSATKATTTRILMLGLSVICLMATVIGFSRGGFLGVAASALFCFWYSPRKLMAILSVVVGLAAVMSVAPDSYWEEMESIGDTDEGTADMRLELWAIATRQFLDNPVLGVGPGNYKWRIEEYQTEDQVEKMGRSLGGSAITHSTYFEVIAELGGVGAGFFLAMLYFAFRELRRIASVCRKTLDERRQQQIRWTRFDQDLEWLYAYALAFTGGLIGYLICSAFLSTTYFSTIWVYCAASVALRYVTDDLTAPAPHPLEQPDPSDGPPTDRLPANPTDPSETTSPPRLSDLLSH